MLTVDYGSSTTNFIAQVNTADLSTGATLTTASTLSFNFTLPGDTVDSLNFGYDGEAVGCFAVADGGNILYQINRFSYLDSIIAGVEVPNIEAMTFDRSRVDILGANANRLGIIDKVTGGFDERVSTFGTGGGAAGNITLSDVDAIGMEATQDTLWAVYQTRLFVANSTTGAHVPNYFGTNIDYITVTGTGGNIDDVAVDPTTGTLYATQATTLYTINTTTGAATSVGAMGVSDMEGMTFSEDGVLYGTTGTGAGASSNSFFSINKATGAATLRTTFSGEGTDFESCECLGGSTLGGILPIYMTRFDVNVHDDHIDINWTAYDDVLSTYIIERRNNEGDFLELAEFDSGFNGKENSYEYEDVEARNGVNYYRIKKIDQQGNTDYSVVKAARINEERIDQIPFEVYPNPSKGLFKFNRSIDFKLYDAQGRFIKAFNTQELDLTGSKPGFYFLEGSSERINKILIIR